MPRQRDRRKVKDEQPTSSLYISANPDDSTRPAHPGPQLQILFAFVR
jgi:hypothetical protein